jgi:hypothetical protein
MGFTYFTLCATSVASIVYIVVVTYFFTPVCSGLKPSCWNAFLPFLVATTVFTSLVAAIHSRQRLTSPDQVGTYVGVTVLAGIINVTFTFSMDTLSSYALVRFRIAEIVPGTRIACVFRRIIIILCRIFTLSLWRSASF